MSWLYLRGALECWWNYEVGISPPGVRSCALGSQKRNISSVFLMLNEEAEAQKAKTRATVVTAEKQILIASLLLYSYKNETDHSW